MKHKPHCEFKVCKDCKKTLHRDDFYTNGRNSKTRRPECKECNKIRSTKWGKRNPYKRKGYLTKTHYGITREEYNKLLERSENKCEICGIDAKNFKRALNIDHNHITGKVRGLLCGNCNQGIGHLKDSIDTLKKAIEYLEKNGT